MIKNGGEPMGRSSGGGSRSSGGFGGGRSSGDFLTIPEEPVPHNSIIIRIIAIILIITGLLDQFLSAQDEFIIHQLVVLIEDTVLLLSLF